MNPEQLKKLIPALKIVIKPRHQNLRNILGPEGRLKRISKDLTDLIRDERIQMNLNRGEEVRTYAERLIGEAIRNGDCHIRTMEIADFYLKEKQLIHKLFKVIAPRLKDCKSSYTLIHNAPNVYPGRYLNKVILEIKGNPYPPVRLNPIPTRNWIHNVLLEEAIKEYKSEMNAENIEDNQNSI